jgi:phytoene dehydrogenase-like protein
VSERYDAVFVGSGINALAGAALLARAGRRCLVLEQNERLGGAVWTAEITEPGFVHEVLAAWHPLFTSSAAYAELEPELGRRGLEYLNTDLPTGSLFPDGSSVFLATSHDVNVEELERCAPGDGEAWRRAVASFLPTADLSFGLLGTELWSRDGAALGLQAYRRLGRRGVLGFTGAMLASCRDWLSATFASADAAGSGFMTQVIAVALEQAGMPVPRGGGARLVEALAGVVRDSGGAVETRRDVERVLVDGNRAVGVRTADGETVWAGAVVAGVTPTQLYGRLLADTPVPEEAREAARTFRYGRGGMQIHMALSEPPRWDGDERLGRTAIVHVTPGLDGVSRAVNEADRGLLPAEATIVVGQPCAVDPSRSPSGQAILWIQLQELPPRPKGDAAGELDVGEGTWTEALRERYADRPTASRPGSRGRSRTSSRRSESASCSRRPRSRRPTRTWSAATSTPAPARSTRVSSGGRAGTCPATAPRSPACTTSARAPIPGRAWAPDPAPSSPATSCARAASAGRFASAVEADRDPIDI